MSVYRRGDQALRWAAAIANPMKQRIAVTFPKTTAWMTDAAKDATTLLTPEAQPTAYAKKAGELAQAAMQDIPARLFAYAEVAKKAQTELLDTVVTLTPKVVEEAAATTKAAAKSAKKAA